MHGDSKILAFDGSIGYGIGGGRVELEVGYEKFKTKGVKRGDGDEEGIYLLAKDLAYNVALDQTDKLTEGIKQLTKKNMHEVSKAIKNLDPGHGIDKKICKTGGNNNTLSSSDADGKCATSSTVTASPGSFVKVMSNDNTISGFAETDKMSVVPKTSATISNDVSKLTSSEKGVVSSAFAKAHEGAEIVIARYTSMMYIL